YEAAEILERALSAQPHDVELLSMLASTYVEAEDAVSAERVTLELVRREATSYPRFAEVARLFLKKNEVDRGVNLIAGITEQSLVAGEDAQVLELLNEALAQNPEHLEALRLLFRFHTWHQDEEGMRLTLERLTEASRAAGQVDEERRALMHLIRLAPDDVHYQRRLEAVGGSLEDDEEQIYNAQPARNEVPTFESFMLMNEEATAEAPAEQQEAASNQASSMEFEWNSVAQDAAQPPEADPSSSFADLNDWTDTSASSQPASTGFNEFDFSTPPQTGSARTGEAGAPAEGADRAAILKQELESVDFYIAQGYTDIALDTLNMIERQFGASPETEARRAQLQHASPSSSDFSFSDAAPPPPAEPPVQTSEDVEFTGFSRYDLAEEVPRPDAKDADDVDAAFTSLAGWNEPPATEAAQNAPTPPVASGPTPQQGIDPGLAAVFDEFRMAVEDESATPTDGDYETHYNLGLAYKEMDLVDEAVEEFQMAAGMVSPQDGTPRYLQCCNLLGHCFIQKGIPRLAAM
ncbi:MAG TPA: hypothetical protein VEQ40_01175, partial [Pyrinomonadaceae bacterium]|nr:hypothetical protein [Pyrinomonadaceae bacterium]